MSANPFLLAADNSPALLPLLRENPALASGQDGHGYSLVHAAASYNHLDLLRALIREFHVDVNLRDEDEETALFVVETVDAARLLVEELGADITIKGSEGYTAREKIEEEGDYPEVAEYLRSKEESGHAQNLLNGTNGETGALPPIPNGLNVSVNAVTPAEADGLEVDPEFRRRIEELAERDDFHSEAGQAELRQLVQDAIGEQNLADRNVRSRQD
ncbi:ankyrin repeat-containing protein [Hypoxylon rubiginosum]|uniref:Ankyrin repeat-containing protein n=1 Tax=Hypoxylon rubiginosum TaxID=110542 RepID=A0ACC0D0N9_9PEZI|nr:ankyrin repeat-containing protein [Hypoxylon rubiginosum]